MKFAKFTVSLACAVLVIACGNSKALSDAALKTANDEYNAVSADAEKYVPDQARSVKDTIAEAQAASSKGDYAASLDQAKAVPAKVTDLTAAITAKKAELTKKWGEISTSLPGLVSALQSRVDVLSKSKGVPAGLTKDTVDQAKTGFDGASQEWADAMAAAKSGDYATAMDKASDAKIKIVAIMTSLKMQIPKSAL